MTADSTPCGVLNIDKPAAVTSFDVVARVRRATGVRRVGHAGTLDPLATGVLLVCLGRATRAVPYLQEAPKTYLATLRLGQLTTTYDAEGSLVREVPVPIELDVRAFIGLVMQRPPLFSALKREGRPLYAYARAGQEVDVPARQVRIDAIDVVTWEPPTAVLRVRCGKGTYIRSLANDLGGHLTALRREAVGGFRVESALSLDALAAWENELVPVEAALARLPRLALSAEVALRVSHGQAVDSPAGEVLATDATGRAVAILRDGQPTIVFAPAA